MPSLHGSRYNRSERTAKVARLITDALPGASWEDTNAIYDDLVYGTYQGEPSLESDAAAFLGCNDRFFLLTRILGRRDANHPWLFARCREVENDPDGYLDLWSRAHYKSTIITFAGAIQEIVRDPEIKIAIFSVVKPIAQEFLAQIKEEFESNERLKQLYPDVMWLDPRKQDADDGRPTKWGIARGITVKRKGNPKEATIEAHGLLDGQPTSRHFDLHIYDDIVTQDYIAEDQIKKTMQRWEMADNLGTHQGVRKQIAGTFYHFNDCYVQIRDRGAMKVRLYPATHDGSLNGKPVFLSEDRWEEIKQHQRSTVSAQMLLNPVAGNEATFRSVWFKTYEIVPAVLNVYITIDPSKGVLNTQRSDRTAIAVIGVDQAGNKYFLDGVCHRMKLSDRWMFIKQLYYRWLRTPGVQAVMVGYEQYGMVNDLEVIEEMQLQEGNFIPIEELSTPRRGKHAKPDRIERLEPDVRLGEFFFPISIYNPDIAGAHGQCHWYVWTDSHQKKFEEQAKKDGTPNRTAPYNVGQVVYRPAKGLTRLQQTVSPSRVVQPIRRRDENNELYDVTRMLILEMMQHPFAPHDDLLDATSRVYDLEPKRPVQYEASATDGVEDDMIMLQGHGDMIPFMDA